MFSSNSCLAGHFPLTKVEMPLAAIMILSTQAAFCCTTLMDFLLAVPGKEAQSWTLITRAALFWCSKAVPARGNPVHRCTASRLDTKTSIRGALTAAKDFVSLQTFGVTTLISMLCDVTGFYCQYTLLNDQNSQPLVYDFTKSQLKQTCHLMPHQWRWPMKGN